MALRKAVRRRIAVAVILAATASLMLAGPASAYLRNFNVISGSGPFNSLTPKGELLSVQPCVNGYIGGGAFVSPTLPNLGLTEMMPFGGFLYGAAETDSESAKWKVFGRGYCVENTNQPPPINNAANYVKAVSVSTANSVDNSLPSKSALVKCPGNRSVISGGGRIVSSSPDLAMTSIQRIVGGTTLRVTVHEVDATDASWHVEARAVCANITKETPTVDYVGNGLTVVYNPPTTASSADKSLTRTCPPGTAIVGGGARVMGAATFENNVNDVVITRSEPVSNGQPNAWIASARETDPINTSWRLNVFIACAPLNGGPPA